MEPDVVLPTAPVPNPDFDALFVVLASLSRKHLLYFRIQVGRAVAEALYGGSLQAYQDQSSNKEGSLRKFASERKEELEDLGLSEVTLRQCVRGWFVLQDLPKGVMEKLGLSHLNALVTVEDVNTRRLLAQAAFDNGWTGTALRLAIKAAEEGRWIDGDPKTAGLQPPAPEPEPEREPQPGRLVTRFEQTSEELDTLIAAWERVPAEKRTKGHHARMRKAVAEWKEKIARIEAQLPPK